MREIDKHIQEFEQLSEIYLKHGEVELGMICNRIAYLYELKRTTA